MIVLFNFAFWKMHPPNCVLMSVLLMIADGLIVHGPSGPLVAPLGSSVVLLCYVNELSVMEDLEVEWTRTDSETLVHLYQDGESRPESQQQEYRDRAHFFTDQIQHGNFSLRLDNLRAEDEGRYTCRVHSQQDSGETVVQIKYVERLLVSGSDEFMSVGEDVTLSCSVDSHITPEHIEEVSWRKTDGDILVLLFQNNKTLPDSSDEQYRDRAELFTAEIPKGNFSLRLKSVRTEDKGVYMCLVFAGGLSANATVVLERLGFSVLHVMVLILCISASGSALLLCYLIYCRSHEKVLRLQVLLVFCPNMNLFFAFILWGFAEGSMHETVSCCTLYFTRPLMLFWAAPYLKDFPVLLRRTWSTIVQYTEGDKAMITALFVLMLLLCLIKVIKGITKIIVEKKSSNVETRERINHVLEGWDLLSCRVLPLLQFILVFYSFGAAKRAFFVTGALPLIVMLSDQEWYLTCLRFCSDWIGKVIRLVIMLVVNAALFPLLFLYFKTLENEKDRFALVCMVGLFQVLSMIRFSYDYLDFPRVHILYLFGAVVLVLVNSTVLMTELILQAVNGERTVEDLRMVIFPSECLFILIGMAVEILTFLRSINKQIKQKKIKDGKSGHKHDPEKTAEFCEMDPLPAFDCELSPAKDCVC
uniref:Ig-like domain-containing protein n=1 Tax=Cyprinus carpio TaxID=7962 RepID=A0A8C1LQH0_CYPCA